MYHDDDDLHMCISCHATIAGLENYISHRNAGPCKSQHSIKRSEAPIPVLSPLEISKSEQIRPISSTNNAPSGENLNFLNADFFFSSLELQSRRKDGVFEEVMGIDEVLDEDYEVRDNGQRTVYSSGGKWGYEDYTAEREMWGSKGGEGLDGGDFHEEDVDLHTKSETFKEKSKKKKDKNHSFCETEENTATFGERLSTDAEYVVRNVSPTKSDVTSSPIKVNHPPEDECLSDATKENSISEFGISLDSCNLVMDSLNGKEDEGRYKNANVPPSGHTRGKWIPGSASEGIRKSGNAVEYFCKPCNKNIRNRRSYESHLSTSCHLKKLMKNSVEQGCVSASDGPRLRSRRVLLPKPDPKYEREKKLESAMEELRSQEDVQKNSIDDSQSYLMKSLGVKRKICEDQVSEDCLENVPLLSNMDSLEKTDNVLRTSDDKNNEDASPGKSNSRKRKYNRTILNRACKSGVTYDEQAIDVMMEMRYPEICKETLPVVNNLRASDESSPVNIKDCNDSTTITSSAGIELPSKKSENASLIDIFSIRHPVVNLGYRCDSNEFQEEREKIKTLANTGHFNSSHPSSDKSLQDEMLFGLELIRTDSNIPDGLVIRNLVVKESSSKQIDSPTPEKIDEINGDKIDSNFQLSESVVDNHDASLHGETTPRNITDVSIKSREKTLVIQSEARVLPNGCANHTLTSTSSIPHCPAESVNINEASNDAIRIENVISLSDKTSFATETGIENILQLNTSGNPKENIDASDSHNSNNISENQKDERPVKEVEYFVVIKSSFDENFKDSPIILRNAKETDIPATVNEVTPQKTQHLYPDVLTISGEAETVRNQSGKNIAIVLNNVELRSDGNLDSNSLAVHNEVRSIEASRRQETEQTLHIAFIGSQEQKKNYDKNVDIELGQVSSNVLIDLEKSTQQSNQISQEKVMNKSQNFLGNNQFPGLVNKFPFPIQSNLSAPLNIIFQADAGLDKNSQLLPVYQSAVSEATVTAPKNLPIVESTSPNIVEKNTVPNKKYRPLLPKVSNEPPKSFGIVGNNISPKIHVSFGPIVIDGVPLEIPLIVSEGLTVNQTSSQIGSNVGVPSAPTSKSPAVSEVINGYEGDVLLLLHEKNDAKASSDKVSKDQETMNSDERPAADIPIEICRGENKEPSKGLKSREEDTDPVKYVCGLCGYQSERFWCVDRHIAQHLPRKKQYSCEICDMQFFSKDALKQHSKRHEPKKWTCNVIDCHQAFATKNEWLVHVQGRHAKERTHKCTLCNYSGKTSAALERHMKKHTEIDQSVECNICFKIVKKDSLERHKKIHDSEEFYVCPYCDFKTTFLTNLRRHIKQSDSHPGKKLYCCPFCMEDEIAKDKETSSLKQKWNVFSSNSAHETLDHINTKHPKETDFSFKHHNAGELLRRLLAVLEIHNPRQRNPEKSRSEISPEKHSSVANSNERILRGGKRIQLAAINPAIRSEYPAKASVTSCSQKSGAAKDIQFAEKANETIKEKNNQIRKDVVSDEMPCVLKSWVNSKNSGKIHGMIDDSECLNEDINMVNLTEESNLESPLIIEALNHTTHSSVQSNTAKTKALVVDDVKDSPPRVINSTSASDAHFSDAEKESQICCISNVFTMAESDVDAEHSIREKVIVKETNSCPDDVVVSSRTFSGDAGNVESVSVTNEAEGEIIDLDVDEVFSSSFKELINKEKTFALADISQLRANQIRTSSPLTSSGQNTSLRCNIISDSCDPSKQKTDCPIKPKRKVPHWSSVVEIIEKRDGVISLWPTSP